MGRPETYLLTPIQRKRSAARLFRGLRSGCRNFANPGRLALNAVGMVLTCIEPDPSGKRAFNCPGCDEAVISVVKYT
jgi:hypothetical protein